MKTNKVNKMEAAAKLANSTNWANYLEAAREVDTLEAKFVAAVALMKSLENQLEDASNNCEKLFNLCK